MKYGFCLGITLILIGIASAARGNDSDEDYYDDYESPASIWRWGELRLGGHLAYINPKDSNFDDIFGYGAIIKYKFTDTLGVEFGVDYFRWGTSDLNTMPYKDEKGDPLQSVYYKETDRIYPIYGTILIFSPKVEESARAYLGLGGGYYDVDADIEGNFSVTVQEKEYPFNITGKVDGQWSVHIAAGADFQLSPHIFLNVEARYVFVDLDRELSASNPEKGKVTIEDDDTEFDNWQFRVGLEYSF